DLEAAGIPYAVEGPDGPLYADFHSLRHTYLTLLGRGGVDLRTVQEPAGHSTPTLTARYAHRRLYDLAGAVEKLPPFLPGQPDSPAAVRATGTEGNSLVVPLVTPGDICSHSSAPSCTEQGGYEGSRVKPQSLENKPLSIGSHLEASACTSR